jgi:hypothetical protein
VTPDERGIQPFQRQHPGTGGAGDGCAHLVEASPEIVAETDGPVDNPGGLAEAPDVVEHLREIGRVE